jgi:hypothetical protein
MGSSVNVRSIHALEDLRTALNRFGADARQAMSSAGMEVRRTQEFLARREQYWQGQVQRAASEVDRAQRAYEYCRRPVRDPETGAVYVAPCTAEANALHAAQAQLNQAQSELANVRAWYQRVDEAAMEYQRQAQRLDAQLSNEVPRATGLLDRKINTLQGYMGGGAAGAIGGAIGMALGAAAAGGAAALTAAFQRGAPAGPGAGGEAPRDIQEIPLAQVDFSDSYVQSPDDYKKATRETIAEGLRKLQDVVRPAVLNGATGDDFVRMDQELGLENASGYKQVYDAFYGGNDPIAVERIGDKYSVLSGFHRLQVARELGMETIPACVVGGTS